METVQNLLDYDHPLVKETTRRLIQEESTVRGKLARIFYYVRDEISFGFPPNGDFTKASETIAMGMGQCNTKGAMFVALCKAAGIPARMHFSHIKKEIQRGLFTGLAYWLMPKLISHSWVEVQVDGQWRRIDSYINDQKFYLAGKEELAKRGWDTGYSISCSSGQSSSDLNLDQEAFVQMDAVVGDHGTWDDPAAYYATNKYSNRPNPFILFLYRIAARRINKKIAGMRSKCADGLCAAPLPMAD